MSKLLKNSLLFLGFLITILGFFSLGLLFLFSLYEVLDAWMETDDIRMSVFIALIYCLMVVIDGLAIYCLYKIWKSPKTNVKNSQATVRRLD